MTPQGLRYTRQFRPMFPSRRKSLKIGIGRSCFGGPAALRTAAAGQRDSPCCGASASAR